jgi:hypothetical protein
LQILLAELTAGFGSLDELGRVVIRLLAAMLLGAVVGLQRAVQECACACYRARQDEAKM